MKTLQHIASLEAQKQQAMALVTALKHSDRTLYTQAWDIATSLIVELEQARDTFTQYEGVSADGVRACIVWHGGYNGCYEVTVYTHGLVWCHVDTVGDAVQWIMDTVNTDAARDFWMPMFTSVATRNEAKE